MATAILSNHAKLQMLLKKLDFENDTIKALVMRSGFAFNRDNHATKANIKGTITGVSNISFVAATKKIQKPSGGLSAAGFVVGNKVTISGTSSNNITVTLSAVSDTELTTNESLTDESNTSATLTANDELAAGNGYTADTKTLTFSSKTEDDTNDRGEVLYGDCEWTATGGSIGPTPGVILYDDSTSDDTIICFVDFGGETTTTNGNILALRQIAVRVP